jgi:hypothetical protein
MQPKTQRVLEALERNPSGLTAGQLRTQYRVGNPRAEVHRLRMNGTCVYSNRRVNTRGEVRTVYTLGQPTPELIAAGWRALRLGV